MDVNSRDHLDGYVYKVVKGWAAVGDKKAEFSFRIPCFQRLMRIKIELSEYNGNLRVVVKDADYEVKLAFY